MMIRCYYGVMKQNGDDSFTNGDQKVMIDCS